MSGVLNQQGIQQHKCNILEGGKDVFAIRKKNIVYNKEDKIIIANEHENESTNISK